MVGAAGDFAREGHRFLAEKTEQAALRIGAVFQLRLVTDDLATALAQLRKLTESGDETGLAERIVALIGEGAPGGAGAGVAESR